jgi:hypothetical protein
MLMATQSQAVQYSASSGSLSASVNFTISGNTLTVVLANTSTTAPTAPAGILTGVFFTINGATLTPVSAVLTAGSTVVNDPDGQPAGGVVGGEWAYGSGLAGAPGGATMGLSSSGLGLFGNPTFPGGDLETPGGVDGIQYGIVTSNYVGGSGNGGIKDSAFIKNSVTFTLTFTGTINLAAIEDISFQYGTALTEPNLPVETPPPGVPDAGSSMILLGFGLIGLSTLGWRYRRVAA